MTSWRPGYSRSLSSSGERRESPIRLKGIRALGQPDLLLVGLGYLPSPTCPLRLAQVVTSAIIREPAGFSSQLFYRSDDHRQVRLVRRPPAGGETHSASLRFSVEDVEGKAESGRRYRFCTARLSQLDERTALGVCPGCRQTTVAIPSS